MRVLTNEGQTFDVRFYKQHRGEGRKHAIDTVCIVSSVNPTLTGRERFHQIGSGVARHNTKDRYSKVMGKRVAMGRALVTAVPETVRPVFEKAFEKEFAASR